MAVLIIQDVFEPYYDGRQPDRATPSRRWRLKVEGKVPPKVDKVPELPDHRDN